MIYSRHYQQKLPKYFSLPMSVNIQENHHLRFVDFLVTSNIAFNVCCNKELRIFMCVINPNYYYPFRRVISDRLLQKRYSECPLKLVEELKNASDVTITMYGWKDVSNNSIYALIAITSVKQCMLNIIHFT